ncbi:MAG: 2-C-methyl-D-erythritol 2,4-cyclodiphosphate synthase [Bdellovibrionota bacterium]
MNEFPFDCLRTGFGYDVHPFEAGRPLMLGGIEIAHDRGLAGHSDADVLLHALTDAVLGALAWGDIGTWFPNTDQKFRGADSKELFRAVWAKATEEGWMLVNCDSVIIAECPKLNPHMLRMRESIASLFGSTADRIGLKATTNEKLGFVGREEGIAAQSSVLLYKKPAAGAE